MPGYLDDGQLVVVDRSADVLQAADGTASVSDAFIENKLKFSPYVTEAVAFCGEGRPAVAAMLSIDGATVGAWAHQRPSATPPIPSSRSSRRSAT